MALNLARRKSPDDEPEGTLSRPPIWVEGRQRPRFDLTAFLHVATALARRDLVPAMDDASARLAVLGRRVQGGELRLTLPRALRLLPPHQRVGAAILGLHGLFGTARQMIVARAPADPPVAYPGLVRRPSAPVLVVSEPAHETRSHVEPTLHAIRTAIHSLPHEPTQAAALPRPVDMVRPVIATTGARAHLRGGAAAGLLGLLMLFAWPGGAVRALIYHLNGGDLRDWS